MKRTLIAGVVACVVVAAAAICVPWSFGFPHRGSGDQHVLDTTGPYLSHGYRREAAVAIIPPSGEPSFAGWGADENSVFEIGSITKTFTAHLLADAIERQEISADTRAEDVFVELKGTSAGKVTMEQLATHTSGLPRITNVSMSSNFTRKDPYTADLSEFLDTVADLEVTPGEIAYSNTGYALLGQAVAKKAGKDYPTLVRERLLEPLGMDQTTVPSTPEDLPDDHPTGYTVNGLPAGAWTMHANAPAGSIRSTTRDISTWLIAVRDGKAPGSSVEPTKVRAEEGKKKLGLAWHTTQEDGATVIWHNGGTGGYTSFAGFNANGDGVVVLNNTATNSDDVIDYLFDAEDTK